MNDTTKDSNIIDLPQIVSEAAESVHNVPFSMISRELIQKSGLSPESRMLIIYLISFGKGWIFYDEVIRRDLNDIGRDKLERMFRELRERGYLKNVQLRGADGRVCGSSRIFSGTPEFLASHRDPEKPGSGEITETLENRGPGKPVPGKTASKYSNSKYNNSNKIIVQDKFDQFWTLYPEKRSKQQALKIFTKIITDSPELFGIIMNAIHHQNRERSRRHELGLLTPSPKHPTTWLNQGCWTDETKTEEQLNEEYNRNRPRSNSRHQAGQRGKEKLDAHIRSLAERVQAINGSGNLVDF